MNNRVAVQRAGLITCSSRGKERHNSPVKRQPVDWKLLEFTETIPVGTHSLCDHAKWISFANTQILRGACFAAVTTNLAGVYPR